MARTSSTLVGLAVILVLVLILVPIVKRLFPTMSGFEDMTCEEGLKPCDEGYFCEQRTCVPILPRYNVNDVKPNSGFYN